MSRNYRPNLFGGRRAAEPKIVRDGQWHHVYEREKERFMNVGTRREDAKAAAERAADQDWLRRKGQMEWNPRLPRAQRRDYGLGGPARRERLTSRQQISRMMRERREAEEAFEPESPPAAYARPHHFSVNSTVGDRALRAVAGFPGWECRYDPESDELFCLLHSSDPYSDASAAVSLDFVKAVAHGRAGLGHLHFSEGADYEGHFGVVTRNLDVTRFSQMRQLMEEGTRLVQQSDAKLSTNPGPRPESLRQATSAPSRARRILEAAAERTEHPKVRRMLLEDRGGKWSLAVQEAEATGRRVDGRPIGRRDLDEYLIEMVRLEALDSLIGKKQEMRSNAARGVVDPAAMEALELWIDNNSHLSPHGPQGQGRSIVENLLKKFQKEKYDPQQAPKLWGYLMDSGAKDYAKQSGERTPWNVQFNTATRRALAERYARQFEEEVRDGEWDWLEV